MSQNKRKKTLLPLILIILDGWGIDRPNKGNAVSLSDTPNFDKAIKKFPFTKLGAHGKFAGLPSGQVGNSEAGHMNIGAGRLVEQDSVKISRSISNGVFWKNPAFLGAIRHVKKFNSNFHIMGMLSNGQSPHSDPGHLYALLNLAKQHNVNNVFLHFFTDGRDSPKYVASKLVDDFETHFFNNEKIASLMGRFYAMDRKKEWKRTEKAYNALVLGKGRRATSVKSSITQAYNRGENDEFIEPNVFFEDNKLIPRISDYDSIVFFNLRSDRARQLAKAFVQKDFFKKNPGSFKRKKVLNHLYFVSMTDFGPDLDDIITAFPSPDIPKTLPMMLKKFKQLYIAEAEKFAHVTYFLNGGYSGSIAGEKRKMFPSPDVISYDKTPSMSTKKLTDFVLKSIDKNKYDFTVLNFAAPDMIGHTGNLKASIKCCSSVDYYLGKIIDKYLSKNGTVIVTADHGNIEKMINVKTDEINTEHTTNKVPFILINNNFSKKMKLRSNGILADIAPTILYLLNIKKPREMKGKSLVVRK